MKKLKGAFIFIFLLLIACSGSDTVPDSPTPSGPEPSSPSGGGNTGSSGGNSPTWWHPSPGTSWQIQFTGTLNLSFDVKVNDLDLFDTPQSVIDQLHAQGRKVICYFSAGSWEDWRPDAGQFPEFVKGKGNGWPGEKYLDIRQLEILSPIMKARLDLAVSKKCDGVDPDNVAIYDNDTGFPLSSSDQLIYNKWLSSEAHLRKLSIGLKNDLDQIQDLVQYFDFAINEQCFQYNECNKLLPFIQSNKAVFGIEYTSNPAIFCPQANSMNFDFLLKHENLDAYRLSCR